MAPVGVDFIHSVKCFDSSVDQQKSAVSQYSTGQPVQQRPAVQHGTAQYSTVQHSTAQYSTVQHVQLPTRMVWESVRVQQTYSTYSSTVYSSVQQYSSTARALSAAGQRGCGERP